MKLKDRVTSFLADATRPTAKLPDYDRPTIAVGQQSSLAFQPPVVKQYSVLDVIAENTGEATLYRVADNNQQFVLKWYHQGIQPKESLLVNLSNLANPHIMKLIEYGISDGHFYEIQPYYAQGDLGRLCPLPFDYIESVVIPQINDGLHCLHEHKIIHRDIKPTNIFVLDKNQVVLGDYGISSEMDDNVSVRATSMSRTLGYAAPEAATGFVSKETDYYSFGITLLHLYTGRDPFFGMTDMQILYQTINEQLSLPINMPQRLQDIIRGLTCKDRQRRWNYQNVCDWCNHLPVEVPGDSSSRGNIRPYQFNYRKYTNLQELSMAFANDWENAKKHLSRGLIEKYLLLYGEELSNECINLKALTDKDLAVFRLILLMNPQAPLCYRGNSYASLELMGRMIQTTWPTINNDIMTMLQNGCLGEYTSRGGFENDVVDRIHQLTQYAQWNPQGAYYGLLTLLIPDTPYQKEKVSATNLNDLITQLESLSDSVRERICSEILSDPYFFCWLVAKGNGAQVHEWQSIYQKARY